MKTFAHLSRNTRDIDIDAQREKRGGTKTDTGRRWIAIKRQSSLQLESGLKKIMHNKFMSI
jgi:hypothetical protein